MHELSHRWLGLLGIKRNESYLHISGLSKRGRMGRKTVVFEQYGRWKPWLHFHQTVPSSSALQQLVAQYHLDLSRPMCWPAANIASFFLSHRLAADLSDPVVGDSDWLLRGKPRPPALVQRRGATAALNGTVCVRAHLTSLEKVLFSLNIFSKFEFTWNICNTHIHTTWLWIPVNMSNFFESKREKRKTELSLFHTLISLLKPEWYIFLNCSRCRILLLCILTLLKALDTSMLPLFTLI